MKLVLTDFFDSIKVAEGFEYGKYPFIGD